MAETRKPSELTYDHHHRQDLGDIEELAESIQVVGLIHPLLIDKKNRLICGRRRLEACKSLGWTEIEVRQVDLDDPLALRAERDENECRKEFSPTERVAIGKAIREREKAEAKQRQNTGRKSGGKTAGRGRKKVGGNLPPSNDRRAKSRDKTAKKVGWSGKTLDKAEAVVDAAKEDPNTFGDLPERMDQTSVDGAHKELLRRKAKDGLPDSKTPHQEAAEDAGVKWFKMLHKIYVMTTGVRDAGGMRALSANWTSKVRIDYATEARRIISELESWIEALEEK